MVTDIKRTRKGVVAWVPGELDFGGLPKKMRDPARWFVGQVVSKTARGGVDVDGYARMRGDIVREIVGRAAWPAVLDYFKAAIETDPHIKGVRARGYRLGPEVSGAAVCVRLWHPPLVRRVLRWYEECERDEQRRLLPVHRALRDELAALTVTPEMDDAVAALSKAGARVCMTAATERIRHGQSAFSVSKTGRLFSSFTGLSRSLREHVRLAGERVVGIDIATCQPSLLAALPVILGGMVPYASGIKSANIISPPCGRLLCGALTARVDRYHPNVLYFVRNLPDWVAELGSDFRDYRDVCAAGDVYLELADMAVQAGFDIPDDIAPRDWAKLAFLIAVLNGHASRFHMPLARVVGRRWPSLIQFLRRANGSTIAGLQRFESWLVIETVAPRLLSAGLPVLTLHDAVFVRESDGPAARALFESVLDELGLPLRLKGERDETCLALPN